MTSNEILGLCKKIAEESGMFEVVRCKDCKHKYLDEMVWKCPFGLPGGENFFCGYGSKDGE